MSSLLMKSEQEWAKLSEFYSLTIKCLANKKATFEAQKEVIEDMFEGLRKMDKLLKINQGWMASSNLSTADFYAFVFLAPIYELNLVPFDDFENVLKWYHNMEKVEQIQTIFKKWKKTIKTANFMLTYIVPFMKCLLCKCCCSKK